MTELSYPFDADNANGGSRVVSQIQWQQMALGWSDDHVDFPLLNTTYASSALPFDFSISGRVVTVKAGAAWVGGFYYKLTGTKSITVPDNATSKARKDLIVLRADMANAAVTMVLVQGAAATSPVEPTPTRQAGSVWEMPVYVVDVPANNGAITVARRAPHPAPPRFSAPWNAADTNALMPRGSMLIDMESNSSGTQQEYFYGRDGMVTTRGLGKSFTYTPDALYVSALPAANRKGRWRWIAPNTYWFAVTIINDYEDSGAMVTGSNTSAAISLPMTCNSKMVQTASGALVNAYSNGGIPNMTSITALTTPGSSVMRLYYPNPNNVANGLDGFRGFPARSTFYISGVIEANVFTE